MKLKLEGNVFFGEEMTWINSFQTTICNKKMLTEIFYRDDDSFVIKKSFPEGVNTDIIYNSISKQEFLEINLYLLKR